MSPRYRRRYGGSKTSRAKSVAQYAREKHVREAEALSSELGGTDHLVKRWFFSASHDELRPVLNEYGASFGAKAKAYAESALPEWRSGRRRMSGLVAERLYRVIPRHMPVQDRLTIAETLWKHITPSTTTTLAVNPRMTKERLVEVISAELLKHDGTNGLVERYRSRFEWLADRDVLALQAILDHIADLERSITLEAIRLQLPMLQAQFSANRDVYVNAVHTFMAGKHALTIQFDDALESVARVLPSPFPGRSTTATRSRQATDTSSPGCLWATVFVIFVVIVLANL